MKKLFQFFICVAASHTLLAQTTPEKKLDIPANVVRSSSDLELKKSTKRVSLSVFGGRSKISGFSGAPYFGLGVILKSRPMGSGGRTSFISEFAIKFVSTQTMTSKDTHSYPGVDVYVNGIEHTDAVTMVDLKYSLIARNRIIDSDFYWGGGLGIYNSSVKNTITGPLSPIELTRPVLSLSAILNAGYYLSSDVAIDLRYEPVLSFITNPGFSVTSLQLGFIIDI
jgi:hypothetical protein